MIAKKFEKNLAQAAFSICLVLAFSIAPGAGASKGLLALEGQTPDWSGGANVDGYADLAIGIPTRDVGGFNAAGMVGLAYGRSIGLNYTGGETFDFSTDGIFGNPAANNNFGQALAGGRFQPRRLPGPGNRRAKCYGGHGDQCRGGDDPVRLEQRL